MPHRESANRLAEYQAKREFDKTPEPSGSSQLREGPLLYAIHLHRARNEHFDLRLELNGTLRSWAIPKGPSDDPEDKRFAAATEDHPLEYVGFEGVIPTGHYGAGEMVLWDIGTWVCDESAPLPETGSQWFDPEFRAKHEEAAAKALEQGKMSLFLRGERLKGSYALVQTKDGWLFFKHRDRWAKKKPGLAGIASSCLTGRNYEDLARGMPPQSLDPGIQQPFGMITDVDSLGLGREQESFPTRLSPMKASAGERAFDDDNWVFEPKMDGIRTLAFCQGRSVRIITRTGKDQTSQFPEVAAHLAEQNLWGVLDGEIVAFEEGRPSFTAMMKRFHLHGAEALAEADIRLPCLFYAFDLLHRDGRNLRGLPLRVRRRLLRQALLPTERVHLVECLDREGTTFYAAVVAAGFEGAMAKRGDSRYDASGQRSPHWLKLKHTTSGEFVVGGFTPGEGGRESLFGGLCIGEIQGDEFIYRGRVGGGFTDQELEDMMVLLKPLIQKKCPFTSGVESGIHPTWVKPEIVLEVRYAEIMPTGTLRSPVFLRLRPDADPADAGAIEPVRIEVRSPEADSATPASTSDPLAEAVLTQLEGKDKNMVLTVGGAQVKVTNLQKELWPATDERPAATKRDLLRYYTRISPWMLPHLADRPLTLIRYPEGIFGEKFFQKHVDMGRPDFVRVEPMWSDTNKRNLDYVVVDSLATLLWLGQLGTLELHVPSARLVADAETDAPTTFTGSEETVQGSIFNFPDHVRFDLDPYIYSGAEKEGDEPELNREAFERCKTAAFWIRDMLQPLGLPAFVKTTGKTGMHVFVPVLRTVDTQACKQICASFCMTLERMHPRELTTEYAVVKRTGKIFLDYNMNGMGRTLGAAYAPRAALTQAISMPVTWEQLAGCYPSDFRMDNTPDIVRSRGDVWADMLTHRVDLLSLLG